MTCKHFFLLVFILGTALTGQAQDLKFGVRAGIIGDAGAGTRGGCVAAMVSCRVGQPSCSSKAAQARFCMKKSAV